MYKNAGMTGNSTRGKPENRTSQRIGAAAHVGQLAFHLFFISGGVHLDNGLLLALFLLDGLSGSWWRHGDDLHALYR